MNESETQDNLNVNNYVCEWRFNHKLLEAGQLRRAKMHAARLIDAIDDQKELSPIQHQLLEASLILDTTNTKILAAYLQRSPAIIRSEFQGVLTILGKCQIN